MCRERSKGELRSALLSVKSFLKSKLLVSHRVSMVRKIISICVRPMIDKEMGLHTCKMFRVFWPDSASHWDVLPGISKGLRNTDVSPQVSWYRNK